MKKWSRRLLWFILVAFIVMNGIAFMHAWKFTHFSDSSEARTTHELSTAQKLKIVFTGVSNPRPVLKTKPAMAFQTIRIKSNVLLECWLLKSGNARGTVIVFHGYGGEKSSMLDKADVFLDQGYNVLLADFMGSGGSAGNTTTIGYKEAGEVRDVFRHLQSLGHRNIVLFGTSMGAVAIMKAIKDFNLKPSSIILECPFGSLYETVSARFHKQNIPVFPMAGLLVFWGGVQNGFNGFSHNPRSWAADIHCPVLLMYGEKDDRVTRKEIDEIYLRLPGKKLLRTYPEAGHENYLLKHRREWTRDVHEFLFAPGLATSQLPKAKGQ